jgi:hypothetical protein
MVGNPSLNQPGTPVTGADQFHSRKTSYDEPARSMLVCETPFLGRSPTGGL